MTHSATSHAGGRLARIGPALLGASSFACGDVLSKIVLLAGADALTASLARGVVGVALLFAWLRLVPRPAPFAPRARTISLGLGVLFAGNIFLLFKAFENAGLTQLDPVGQPFDPAQHEAMVMQASSEQPPHTVLKVIQKGWLLNGRLLRPARVIVSSAPNGPDNAPSGG